MEEEQNQNQEGQPEVVVEQPKKKIIPTRLGSLIILLVATIAGAGVWWYEDSYTPREVVNMSEFLKQIQERREVKNENITYSEIEYSNLEYYFNKDKNHVYFLGKIIEGADTETFKAIKISSKVSGYSQDDYGYAKDKNNVYYSGKVLPGIDPITFGLVAYDYYFDKSGAYYLEPKVDYVTNLNEPTQLKLEGNIDPVLFKRTFEEFGNCEIHGWHVTSYGVSYVRYQDNIYCGEKLLQGADAASFKNLGSVDCTPEEYQGSANYDVKFYTRDKNHIYINREILKGDADPTSFEVTDCNHFRDKNHIYYWNTINDGNYHVIEDIDQGAIKEISVTNSSYVGNSLSEQSFEHNNKTYTIIYDTSEQGNKEGFTRIFIKIKGSDGKIGELKDLTGKIIESWITFQNKGFIVKMYDDNLFLEIGGEMLVLSQNDILLDKLSPDYSRFFSPSTGGPKFILIDSKPYVRWELCEEEKSTHKGTINSCITNYYIFADIGEFVKDENKQETRTLVEDISLQACLATGTKITMADGSYKNIEDVQVGDLVISYDIETKEHTTSKVDKVIKRKDPLVIINNTLRTAPDEPVYLADGTIKEAIDIKVGDYLVNEKGEQAKVNTIKRNIELVDTYDFTLENGNNFFADGYLVRTPDL